MEHARRALERQQQRVQAQRGAEGRSAQRTHAGDALWRCLNMIYPPATAIKGITFRPHGAAPDLAFRSMVMSAVLREDPQPRTSAGRASTVRS